MTTPYGQKTTLGINFQNSYGTAQVNSLYFLPFISEGFATTKEQLMAMGQRGVFEEGDAYEGMNANEGELELEAHPVLMGVMLKALCGDPTTVTSAAVYGHTYKLRTSDFDKFAANNPVTVLKDLGDSGSSHQYSDMVLSTLGFNFANGEFLKLTGTFMGGNYSQIAAVAASFPAQATQFTWDQSSISIGSSLQADFNQLSVTVEESLENKYTLNNTKRPSRTKRAGSRVINVEGTLILEDQNEYQEFISQTERELIINVKGASEIQSGYTEEFRINLPGLRLGDFKMVAGGPGQIEVGFTGKAIYSVTSAVAIQFFLQNSQAAY